MRARASRGGMGREELVPEGPTFPAAMIDKSINLWRQIEDSRRASKGQAAVDPAKARAEPARQGASG